MTQRAILFRWTDDGHMVPASQFHARNADEQFCVGEKYSLVQQAQRSPSSHNHYFAVIAAAHDSLPDELLETYPTPEHLRKKALIRKGYRNEREYVCASAAAARDLVLTIRDLDDYAIIEARETVVRIWTAKSQSKAAMPGNGEFQKSKADVLEFIGDLLNVDPETLGRQERAA